MAYATESTRPAGDADAGGAALWRRALDATRRVAKGAAFIAAAAGYTLYAGVAVRLENTPRERARATARHQQRGARLLLRILGVRTRVAGRARLHSVGGPHDERERATLLVCNHLGLLDPFVLAAHARMALVGKAEIADWPAAGWVARTMGVVFVERGATHAVEDFVGRVQERLESGVSVLAFPEGTTNADPQVLPFKTGVFLGVAEQEGEAVLPLYLHVHSVDDAPGTAAFENGTTRRQQVIWAGGHESALMHAWRLLGLRRVTMEVRVGEPIATGGRDRRQLARRAQAQVERMATEALAPEGAAS